MQFNAWWSRACSLSVAALLFALGACSDSDSDEPTVDAAPPEDVADASVEDTPTEPDTELPDVIEADVPEPDGNEGSGDVVEEDTSEAIACETTDTCPEGSFCIDGVCNDLSCRRATDWVDCRVLLNKIEPDLGRFAVCRDGRCQAACQFDSECADGETCTDFGRCVPFTGVLGEDPPGRSTGPLQAGIGNTLMNYPVGVPLGGYGERAAFQDGRYAVSLRASTGAIHGLYARTVLLDNGIEPLMIVRLPLIFTGDQLHEDIARILQEETGQDWRDNLMISSTHTHSGPCRHWHLPEEPATPLGSFGIGEFHQFFYDLVLESTLESVRAAQADLSPARIGWTIVEDFDGDDQIGRDRWRATPPFDDNRALLIRIDDPEGTPRAVLFSYGAHATDNGSDYASGDVLAGAERAFEAAIGRSFGVYAPALFLNQNSGSMSPASGTRGHDFPQTMERMGHVFLERVYDRFLAIETDAEMTLATNNLRFPLGYDLMGYARDEFAANFPPPLGGEYHYGGISCSGQVGGDSDPTTFDELGDLTCAGALQFLLNNTPPSTLQRSQILTIELNGLTAQTMPGELSMELSWQVLRELRDTHGVDPLSAWTFGYANDHLFYLLPTNLRGELPPFPGISTPQPLDDYPDFAFSYLQGGYEASMSPWGPSLGDYLVARASESFARLAEPDAPIGVANVLPQQIAPRDMGGFEVDITPQARVGEIVLPMPEVVERFETIEFGWIGGDPGAEVDQVPLVALSRNVDGVWETPQIDSLLPYTNREPLFMTRVRDGDAPGVYEWIVRWEELGAFPTGTYRFLISGTFLNDAEEISPYELVGPTFELVESDDLVVEDRGVSDGIAELYVGYPRDERMRFSSGANDPGAVTGNYRMRHPLVANGFPAPLADDATAVLVVSGAGPEPLVLSGDAVSVVVRNEVVEDKAGTPQSYVRVDLGGLPSGTYPTVATVTDAHGNTGTLSFDLVVP